MDIWDLNNVNVYIDDSSDITISDTVTVQSLVSAGTSVIGQLKNCKIQPPQNKVEQIGTLGQDSRGYRSAHKGYLRSDMAKLTADLIVPREYIDSLFELTADSSDVVGATDYTRLKRGTASPRDVSFIVAIDDGTDSIYIMLHKATAMFGELNIDDGSSHIQLSVEAYCLPTDYYEDFEN